MRAVVQRVSKAAVSVDQQEIGKIGYGLLVLLGIHETDTQKDVDYLVKKIAQMRIFEDEQGKMNISVEDVGGSNFKYLSIHTVCGYEKRKSTKLCGSRTTRNSYSFIRIIQ